MQEEMPRIKNVNNEEHEEGLKNEGDRSRQTESTHFGFWISECGLRN
jgi:hypothetical protein